MIVIIFSGLIIQIEFLRVIRLVVPPCAIRAFGNFFELHRFHVAVHKGDVGLLFVPHGEIVTAVYAPVFIGECLNAVITGVAEDETVCRAPDQVKFLNGIV